VYNCGVEFDGDIRRQKVNAPILQSETSLPSPVPVLQSVGEEPPMNQEGNLARAG